MSERSRSATKLTDDQRKLAEKHHNLIYTFAREYKINLDEYYDLLAIGLCIAARIFDPDKGVKFSTLAYQCMRNQYYNHRFKMRYSKNIPEDKIVSYSEPISEDGYSITLLDTLEDPSAAMDTSVAQVNEFLKPVPEQYRGVLCEMIKGKRPADAARDYGCSRQYITYLRSVFAKSWAEYNNTNT